MDALILTMYMGMGMDVGMLVGVRHAAMAVGMGMNMGMQVGMLQGNGIADHEPCSRSHDGKPEVEGASGPFPQNQHTEGHAEKGRDGVVGAGLRRPQLLLGHNIKV